MFEDLQLFSSIVTSIFIDAAPFLMLGAFLSAALEVYLPQDIIARYTPKSHLSGLFLGLSAGMVFPTCECGVVPVARRLLKKGVPPHIALTYMLSAPVINPVVLVSTYVAFQGDIRMVIGRMLMVAIPACCIGLAVSRSKPDFILRETKNHNDLPGHDHLESNHSHAPDCGFDHDAHKGSRFTGVLLHTASEFVEMGKYLIMGAFAVGLFKIYLPQETLLFFGNNMFLAVGGMMLFAVLLSVCSMADSFLAASLTSFPSAAQLSFVSIGPMVDLKLIAMYLAVFQPRLVLTLIIVPTFIIYLISVPLGMIFG
ncbi:MAG: permease [Pseudomonadota bacterium]